MRFINKYINKRIRAIRTLDNSHNCRIEFDTKRIVNFPYIEEVHQPLQLLLRPYDINLINNNKQHTYYYRFCKGQNTVIIAVEHCL